MGEVIIGSPATGSLENSTASLGSRTHFAGFRNLAGLRKSGTEVDGRYCGAVKLIAAFRHLLVNRRPGFLLGKQARPEAAKVSGQQHPLVTPGERNDVPKWEYQKQPHSTLYQALTARVGHRDALLWQSPALALTAQAFLLTIALGHDSTPVVRILAAGLGLLVMFMSMQLMLKHRMYMDNDQVMMVSLEREMELPSSAIDYDTQIERLKADKTQPPLRAPRKKEGLTEYASVDFWVRGMAIFMCVNAVILLFALAEMIGITCLELPDLTGQAKCYVRL